jgi:prephenate dehydrogenase
MRVALLGFGLIGGSIARAVLARRPEGVGGEADDLSGAIRLVAWSPTGEGPRAAARDRLVELARRAEDALAGADLVVLAAPPLECLALLDSLAGGWREALGADATVTDVASTKRAIGRRAADLGLAFVGGHPMAGRERTGYEASDAELFAGRPWAIVPGPTSRAGDVARVELLARACGARPLHLDAGEHDAAVAAISHLPLVLSAALVESVAGVGGGMPAAASSDWAVERTLAAGGWQSMTRLARGDATMGAGILATNADQVAIRVRALRVVLDDWLSSLEDAGGPDAASLERRLRAAAARLEDGGPPRPTGIDRPGFEAAEAAGRAATEAPDGS